jgi:hypothetical protein
MVLYSYPDNCRVAEKRKLEAKLKTEKQFNRKVELNAALRQIETEISALSDSTQQISKPTE